MKYVIYATIGNQLIVELVDDTSLAERMKTFKSASFMQVTNDYTFNKKEESK